MRRILLPCVFLVWVAVLWVPALMLPGRDAPANAWGWQGALSAGFEVRLAMLLFFGVVLAWVLRALPRKRRPDASVSALCTLHKLSQRYRGRLLDAALFLIVFALALLAPVQRYWGDWPQVFIIPIQHPDRLLNEPLPFWRAPLGYCAVWSLERLAGGVLDLAPCFAVRVGPALTGATIFVVLLHIGRTLFPLSGGRRVLFAAFVVTSGVGILFLSYMELYIYAILPQALYAWASLRALRRRRMPYAAGFWMGVAFLAHPQCLVYAPTLAIPWFRARCRSWPLRIAHGFLVLATLACPVALFLLFQHYFGLPPSTIPLGYKNDFAASHLPLREALSGERVRDLFQILVMVLAALPLQVALASFHLGRRWLAPPVLWLTANVPLALWIAFAINNATRLSYDWDLMLPALFQIALWGAGIACSIKGPADRTHRLIAATLIVSLPWSVLWFLYNWTPNSKQQALLIELGLCGG